MTANSPSNLSGLFKEVYAKTILDLVPDTAKLSKMISFVPSTEREGDYYHQPVIVSNEQGVTYAGPTDGAFTLNASIPLTMQDAQIQGNQIVVAGQMSYVAAAKSATSTGAFKKSTVLMVENMMDSMYKRLEIALLYGGSGICNFAQSGTHTSSTVTTLTATAGAWATGIWAGAENSTVQFYNGSSLISTGADSVFTVTAVDVANKKVAFTGTTTGTTALQSATDSETLDCFFNGSYGKEAIGLKQIFTNTGLLFNINATTYNLWQGNTYTTSGQLTMTKILNAVSLGVQRGLNEDVIVLVNPNTWTNLNTDLAALRRFDGNLPDKGDNAFESIVYHGMNGKIEVISHSCVKEGDAFIFPPDRAIRVGAQEVSYTTPGRDDEIFLQIPSAAGYELRLYTDQGLLIETPARCIYVTGFTNA